MVLYAPSGADEQIIRERLAALEEGLRENEQLEYRIHIGARDREDRTVQYISDEELERIAMRIEITEE